MQSLDLNLSTRPFRNNTLLWLFYVTAALALSSFSLWNVLTYRGYKAKLGTLSDTVSTFEARTRELKKRERAARQAVGQMPLDHLEIQAEKANEVIAWKAFSWTRLFNFMEQVQPWDVRMMSIRPIFHGARSDARDQEADTRQSVTVAVEGIAKTFGDFTEMEDALHQSEYVGRVEPGNLQRTKNGEIAFSLKFHYYPELEEPQRIELAVAPGGADAEGSSAEQDGDEADGGESSEETAPPDAEPPTGEVTPATEAADVESEPARTVLAQDPEASGDDEGGDGTSVFRRGTLRGGS